jgi:hypothetical protein
MSDCKNCKRSDGIQYDRDIGFHVICSKYGVVKPSSSAFCEYEQPR